MSRKIAEAQKGTVAEKAAADKAAADKAAADKAAADAAAAPAKPDAAKPDVDATDDQFKATVESEVKGLDPKQAKAWADLRYSERALRRGQKDLVPAAKLKELQDKLTVAEAKVTDAPADPAVVAQLKADNEALKKRDVERENELMVAQVERTEAFQIAVTKPIKAAQEQVSKFAKKYELDAGTLMNALTDTSDNQSDLLESAMEKMNSVDKTRYIALVDKIAQANEKGAVLRANAKEALEKVSAKTSVDLEAAQKIASEARKAAHSANWTKLKELIPDVLSPVEGTDDVTVNWTKAQTDAEVFARDTEFGKLKPDVQSQVLQRAAVFPLVMGRVKQLETQVTEAQTAHKAALERLAKFEAAYPNLDASKPSGEDTSKAKGPVDFVERVSARFREAGL